MVSAAVVLLLQATAVLDKRRRHDMHTAAWPALQRACPSAYRCLDCNESFALFRNVSSVFTAHTLIPGILAVDLHG